MLSKHFILCVCLQAIVYFRCSYCELKIEKSVANLNILKNVVKLTDTLLGVTPFINITISEVPSNCVPMVCKFVCFNGQASEIARDIDMAAAKNNNTCNFIEELRLYNYNFPDNKLSYGFLGPYSDKVKVLYLASSNITDIARGSFANGAFVEISFENLKLTTLKKDFFQGITTQFQALSVVQKANALKWVNGDFLDHVRYQIKHLTMQVGLSCVRNLTGSENLLNNLVHVDFSYNNFGQSLVNTVFCKLSMVEHMDLSHSNIEYLPPYVFSDFVSTLEYLDVSHNRLKTLSHTVFGWREIPRDLKIYANDNEWECSCEFQNEMKEIILYQTTKMLCSEPEIYKNWSIFDDLICEHNFVDANSIEAETGTTTSVKENQNNKHKYNSTPMKASGTTKPFGQGTLPPIVVSTTVPTIDHSSVSTIHQDCVEFNCPSVPQSGDNLLHALKWPPLEFSVLPQDQLKVSIIIEPSATFAAASVKAAPSLNETFGLIWFSKVTTEYYKMEINYNEYGLGCYNSISYVTTVGDLIPNMAYTFCMVLRDQLTISPFNCKSIHVKANLNIQYSSAWLTRDMKSTGLSLAIFGIVMFSFAGILLIYLLLKHKPILLKGSKRVTTPGGNKNTDDIVVMPRAKSVKSIKDKQDILAKRGPPFSTARRRNSSDSVASYESYINPNLYEVIPAYIKLQNIANDTPSTSTASSPASIIPQQQKMFTMDTERDCSYMTPLSTILSTADLVTYAEIPYRTKRVSNDPLPEVPIDQEPYNGISFERSGYSDIGIIYMLDSQV